MKINKNWKLYYSKENNVEKFSSFPFFDNVKLPTLFELEIFKNGLLGHPYYSTNNWDYQKYEDYHQYYYCTFNSAKSEMLLKLNGVDTIADIYVNGVLVGKTKNAYISYEFKLINLKKKNNELLIHIYPSVVEGLKHDFSNIRQCAKYNFESLYMRKPASSFGWDILPRTPLGGIYKDVELIEEEAILKDIDIKASNVSKILATLFFKLLKLNGIRYKVSGKCKDSSFELEFEEFASVNIANPYLWTIRGYGDQNLYEIKIDVIKDDTVIESKTIKYGIRKVELIRSSNVCENGHFEFHINDEKVFLLGSNWVPTEAIKHVDNKRAKKAIDMLVDLGCNAIRIWGGGTYETEELYSLCDELGFFIWQDFMMGCATYPQDDEFAEALKEEVEIKVKELRNHCSICLWAGDNENDCASAQWAVIKDDPNKNILTRKVIPEVLSKLDGTRPYLPSSPYIDEFAYAHKELPLSEDHLWGPRDYFKGDYYKVAYPYFTSETGYHGLNSVKSLNKFMKKPWPLFTKDGNPTKEYMCHGVSIKDDMNSPYLYRTKLMSDQVKTLFTNKISKLEDFVLASQISQAEAMKYFVEKMRRDTNRNGGIIWWNILDGWPQVSDAVVDYYFDKKLAYNYIKKSQQEKLIFIDEDENLEKLYVSNLTKEKCNISYSIIDAYTNEEIKKGTVSCLENQSKLFDSFVNDNKHHFYIIRFNDNNGNEYINTFHTNVINIDLSVYKKVLKKYNYFK